MAKVAPGTSTNVADAVVVGSGIIGAACAHALAQRGLSVVVVDRSTPADGTSSHCEGNLLVSDKGPGAELTLSQHALALWPGTVAQARELLGAQFPSLEFEPKGGIVVTTTESGAQPLLDFAAVQREYGVAAEPLSVAEALEREPWLNPEITAAMHYPQDSQVQPVIATEALLAMARINGAQLLPNCEVTGLTTDAHGAVTAVETAAGPLATKHVVLAAGPWSGEVSQRFGAAVPVKPRKGYVLVTSRMPHRVFHKVYDGDYFGATQSSGDELQTAAVVESSQAGTVLIGSSREKVGFDRTLKPAVYAAIAQKALRVFPFLRGANIMRAYSGFRPYMPDHLPIIGPDPRVAGLFHASGHEGAGIGLSLATAELIAGHILGEAATSPLGEIDPRPFQLDRETLAPHLEEVA